jgi:hypothetical protein
MSKCFSEQGGGGCDGPPVASPTGQGFGSRLINRAMSARLSGALSCDWAEDGVIVTLKMDRQSLEV